MIPAFSDNPVGQCWPFWVLELTPSCSIQDIERAAREITARITLQVAGADGFCCPGGKARRDAYLVREARARLLNPQSRLLCEFWYMGVAEAMPAVQVAPVVVRDPAYWWKTLGEH